LNRLGTGAFDFGGFVRFLLSRYDDASLQAQIDDLQSNPAVTESVLPLVSLNEAPLV